MCSNSKKAPAAGKLVCFPEIRKEWAVFFSGISERRELKKAVAKANGVGVMELRCLQGLHLWPGSSPGSGEEGASCAIFKMKTRSRPISCPWCENMSPPPSQVKPTCLKAASKCVRCPGGHLICI